MTKSDGAGEVMVKKEKLVTLSGCVSGGYNYSVWCDGKLMGYCDWTEGPLLAGPKNETLDPPQEFIGIKVGHIDESTWD